MIIASICFTETKAKNQRNDNKNMCEIFHFFPTESNLNTNKKNIKNKLNLAAKKKIFMQ